MGACCCSCVDAAGRFEAVLLRLGTSVYSPWMCRRGDFLRATLDLVKANSATSLGVRLYTKNETDTGNGIEVDSTLFINKNTPGRVTQEWGSNTGTGLKELVRYRFTCLGAPSGSWVIFRMLAAVWFDAVRYISPP